MQQYIYLCIFSFIQDPHCRGTKRKSDIFGGQTLYVLSKTLSIESKEILQKKGKQSKYKAKKNPDLKYSGNNRLG